MSRLRDFRDKVVVVTGSSRGIGREIARLALDAGARVVLNGRDATRLESTRVALGHTDRTLAISADLSRPEEAGSLVAKTVASWGKIDVLVNNAGLSMRGSLAELTATTVQSMVNANFLSAVWTTLAALPSLRSSHGRVALISSLAGLRGFSGVGLYSASKMALTALHQSLVSEEGPQGVKFSLVFLPFTENDPDKTVLTATGELIHHERAWSFSQVKAAQGIWEAVARGRKRTIFTLTGRALAVGQALFPGVLDWLLATAKPKIHTLRPPSS